MAQPRKQVANTGNGDGSQPILADGKPNTADLSKPSPAYTGTASGSIKPVSLRESLSLLQTLCFDLQAQGCRVSILARNSRFYIVGELPSDTGILTIFGGHISIDGKPVSEE